MYDVCFAYIPKKFKKNLASLLDYEASQISILQLISSGNPGICCGYTYLWKSAEINCFVGAMSVRYPPFLRPLCTVVLKGLKYQLSAKRMGPSQA